MNIKEIIIKNYPLISKADSVLDCYYVGSCKYIIFWDDLITKDELRLVLKNVVHILCNGHFPSVFVFVIIGKTNDTFNNDELLFFYPNSSTVAFYLVDDSRNVVYFNNHKDNTVQQGWRKEIVRINEIISSKLIDRGESNES